MECMVCISGDKMIVILSSEPGKGKTFQSMGWEEPILYLDMENRTQKTFDSFYKDRVISLKKCMAFTKDYQEDHVKTLENFQVAIKSITPADRTIVIDGISELRDYAVTKWAKDNNRKRPVNPGDWEEINDIVRGMLFPLVNRCRAEGINLVMTSQFKDDYETVEREVRDGNRIVVKKESVKKGRVPALKEWQTYNADVHIILDYKKPKYMATCVKSSVGCFEIDITDKSLYDELVNLGV